MPFPGLQSFGGAVSVSCLGVSEAAALYVVFEPISAQLLGVYWPLYLLPGALSHCPKPTRSERALTETPP
jgi:hypothetical protein